MLHGVRLKSVAVLLNMTLVTDEVNVFVFAIKHCMF